MTGTGQKRRRIAAALFGFAALTIVAGLSSPAAAQSVVVTVNDSPITNYDIAQRSRLLGVLRMPSSQQAAIESLVKDRLRLMETRKYGINPSEQDIANEAAREAATRKMSAQQLGAGLQRARIDQSHWQEHWRAEVSWRILISALNKSVNVSEEEVRAEMQKRGTKTNAQEFRLQQIVFVVPRTASAGQYAERMREANGLRARFRDCTAGIQLARALRDVAVQPQISRRANTLSADLLKVLERTPVGQLSPPQRGPTGVEMVAVCGKSEGGNSASASDSVREELLSRKLQGNADKRYQDLRKRAIIVRR